MPRHRSPYAVRLVFAADAPCSPDRLRSVLERHHDELERLEAAHALSASVRTAEEPTLELELAVDTAGPAVELELLAAVHELELLLADEGLALRSLGRAA
jgi:hypothetical protein